MTLRPLAASLLTLPAFALVAQAAPAFRDIPPGSWAERPATVLAEERIMPGRTPIDFAGTAPITRYELAHIISDLYTVGGPPSTFIVFGDLPPGHAATQDVQRVIGYGLMETRKPGKFEGEAAASRKEVVEAFDELFEKNFITPPARRDRIAYYTDVKADSPLGKVLERVVNRFGLIAPKPGTRFNPYATMSRYDVLSMLVRAMPYLNPTLAERLKAPPPTPAPSPGASTAASPGATPAPAASPNATVAPATPAPSFAPGELPAEPILRGWGYGAAELVLAFTETLPTEPGATAAGEPKQFSGNMLGGGSIGGDWWNGRLGVGGRATSFFLPVDLSVGGQVQPNNILDTLVQANAGYKLAGGPDWEAALGAGALVRVSYNMSALGATYLTSDKTSFGLGPALAYGYRAGPGFTFTSDITVYPVIMQNYTLAAGSASLMRWGADGRLRGEYFVTPRIFVSGAGHLFIMGGAGGTQSIVGAIVGGGMTF